MALALALGRGPAERDRAAGRRRPPSRPSTWRWSASAPLDPGERAAIGDLGLALPAAAARRARHAGRGRPRPRRRRPTRTARSSSTSTSTSSTPSEMPVKSTLRRAGLTYAEVSDLLTALVGLAARGRSRGRGVRPRRAIREGDPRAEDRRPPRRAPSPGCVGRPLRPALAAPDAQRIVSRVHPEVIVCVKRSPSPCCSSSASPPSRDPARSRMPRCSAASRSVDDGEYDPAIIILDGGRPPPGRRPRATP